MKIIQSFQFFNLFQCLKFLFIFVSLIVFSLAQIGCTKAIPHNKVENDKFKVADLFKNDTNYTIEISLNMTIDLLSKLTIKLYKKNPIQINKNLGYSASDVVQLIKTNRVPANKKLMMSQLRNYKKEKLLALATDPRYKNDRVLAFIYGMKMMVTETYGQKKFYIFDQIDPQKLYKLARNIEIAFWKMSNSRDIKGNLLILSNGLEKNKFNLSYERIAGKLIAIQDSLSEITAKTYGKAVTKQWIDLSKAFYFII